MNRRIPWVPMLATVLLLAACRSAPTRFYTLQPQSPSGPAAAATASYRIEVLPVTIPAEIDQPQLVVRESDDRVALLEGEQWIGPLDDQIRSAVSAELARRLGAVDTYGLPQAGGSTVYRIKLDVRRFESVVGRYALISAAWSIHDPGRGVSLSCTSSIREPVASSGYGALVRGHQAALSGISEQIAQAIRDLASSGDAKCPAPAGGAR